MLAAATVLLAPRTATAQYTPVVLPNPADVPPHATNLTYAINGAGQIFGSVFSNPGVRPVVWTGNPPQVANLPVPANYSWDGQPGQGFMNESGTMISRLSYTVPPSNAVRSAIVRWTISNGIPQAEIMAPPPSCPDPTDYYPIGVNNLGHVLIYTTGICSGTLLLWNGNNTGAGADFQTLGTASLDEKSMNCAAGFVVHVDAREGRHLNDADHVALLYYDGHGPQQCSPHDPSMFAGILANGTFTSHIPLPGAFAQASGMHDVNNHDQLVAWVGDVNIPALKLWDGAAIVELGLGGRTYLNDFGEAFFDSRPGFIPRIYKHGVIADAPIPQQIPNTFLSGSGGTEGFNGPGQLLDQYTYSDPNNPPTTFQSVLFTPTPPVIAWTPTDLEYSTPLGASQLNATASDPSTHNNIAGTFTYLPPAGTILPVGDLQTLSLTFEPDPLGYANVSATTTVNVTKAPVTVTLGSSVNPSVFGQSVEFTATLSATPQGAQPATGSVEFFDGNASLGSSSVGNCNGALCAVLTTSSLSANQIAHAIGAHYSGDSNYQSADASPLFSQTVNTAATTTTLTSAPNPSNTGQSVTLTATVTVTLPGQGTPTGSVQFFDGATSLGSSPLTTNGGAFTAALSTSSLSTGAHTLTATYGGDSSFAGSTSAGHSHVVNTGTTTTIATSASLVVNGHTFTLTATVSATAGSTLPSGQVTFFSDNGNPGGTVPVGTATLVRAGGKMKATLKLTALNGISHIYSAQYNGNATLGSSMSNPVPVTVYSGTKPTTTTTTLTSSANPAAAGQTITFTGTVKRANGTGAPTGRMQFFADGVFLAEVVVTAATTTTSTAQFSTQLATGTHAVEAIYLRGTPTLASSASPNLAQVVH
jgi:hypothetical protein